LGQGRGQYPTVKGETQIWLLTKRSKECKIRANPAAVTPLEKEHNYFRRDKKFMGKTKLNGFYF